MTDHFEKAKDRILKEARANGGVTVDHLFDALIATNDDLDEKLSEQRREAAEKHGETLRWHQDVLELLRVHGVEANVRDERLDVLEMWRTESSLTCVARVKEIAAEVAADLHGPTHERHMLEHHASVSRRAEDPQSDDHTAERGGFPRGDQRTLFEMMLGWSIVKWAVAIAAAALIIAGISYWTSSCAAARVEEEVIQQGGGVHMVLPSPTP